MSQITPVPVWSPVRVLEEMEPALGGINGNMNEQAQQLANRLEFLKENKADYIYVDDKISGVSGGYAGSFLTFALMDAAKSTLPLNCSAKVSNDPDNSKNGEYTWNGSIFTKSAYDPLIQAINYFNSNPNFKPIQIVAGNNFNNITQAGVYFHWGANLTEAQVLNAPLYASGNLAFGVLIVYNASPTGTKNPTTHQIFYPFNDGYAPFFRKVKQSTSDFGTWTYYITKENQFNIDMLASGVDILTLAPGRYGIPSIAIGNSLVNMPNMPYKFGRIEVDLSGPGGYKIIRILPYGRDTNSYINKNYESNVWSGWKTIKDYESFKTENDAFYASKSQLSVSISEALSNVTQDSIFGKQYTTDELKSTDIYSAAYYLGYNHVTGSKTANFNTLKARFWNPNGGEVQYRVYYGNNVTEDSIGVAVPQANVNSPNYSGVCKSCPTSDTGVAQDIVLDQVINIPANTPFVIVFRATSLTTLRCGYAKVQTGNLQNRGFTMLANAAQWGEFRIAVASPSLNYVQAGFQLTLKVPNSDLDNYRIESAALFTSKSQMSVAISEALSNVTQDSIFGKQYTSDELKSTDIYSAAYYLGYNHVTGSKAVTFNSLKARFWNPGGGEVQYRVYYGNNVTEDSIGVAVPQANVNSPNYSGVCKSCPTSDTGVAQDIVLDQVINIPANTPFVIVFRATSLTTLRCGFARVQTGNLQNRGFTMWASAAQWGEFRIAVASPSLNYFQAGFQLIIKIPKEDSSTQPVQPSYKPTLVLPTKVYAMEGLQTHIYPEHLLVEKFELYEHNINCTRGKHMERGFLWEFNASTPDPVGSYPITWELLDAQTDLSLTSATTTLQIVDKSVKSGQTLNINVIGDSLTAAGAITQRLLDIAVNDVMKINLIGTRGSGQNRHEGRGGWSINDYTGVGRIYYSFTVSGIVTTPTINATTYSLGATELLVQETYISNGSGTIVCSINSGAAPNIGSTGTLVKKNTSGGDNNIAFTNVQSLSANPFWNSTTSAIDYASYLSTNGFVAPDMVFIQLGVNDTFGLTTDSGVTTFCETAFAKLDSLIASIKAANATTKVILMTPPTYADQDAFGANYACGQTSRRAKRNIVTYNKALILRYSALENQRIYVLGSGVNVDTKFNFPNGPSQVNSHNSTMVTRQTNGVHPDIPGYRQIADAMFIFMKAA